ncbi:terminase gpA endonuclease subunit [Yersinia ruckeri]|uniref:terminase gpA endonuclease subunit n=1 Tax=Yersinia ruckeri TaxID=29486 RepID=UPI0030C8872E
MPFARLHIDLPAPGSESAGCMHFPADRDLHYFSQLLAERSVVKISGGQRYRSGSNYRVGLMRRWIAGSTATRLYVVCCIWVSNSIKPQTKSDSPERLLPPPVEVEEKNSLRLPGAIIKESDPPSPKRIARRLA